MKQELERRVVWVLFDLDNGHPGEKHYLWWFETRALAMAHRKRQHAMKHGATLSMPQKWTRPEVV